MNTPELFRLLPCGRILELQDPERLQRPQKRRRRAIVSSIKRVAFAGLLAATVSGATITDSHASFVVLPGYDLLLTLPGTQFSYGGNGIPMTGAPDLIRAGNCGSAQWNFGSGCTSIGNTSAILYRPQPATGAANTWVRDLPIQFLALGLRSLVPIDLGSGPELLNAVLANDLGSRIDILFDNESGGQFSSRLNFIVRIVGATSGTPVPFSPVEPLWTINMGNDGATWNRLGPPPVSIAGVNYQLNGQDSTDDFFTGVAIHGPIHIHVTTGTVPVPAAAPLLLTGLLGMGIMLRRRTLA
jgi:hypothetical protein